MALALAERKPKQKPLSEVELEAIHSGQKNVDAEKLRKQFRAIKNTDQILPTITNMLGGLKTSIEQEAGFVNQSGQVLSGSYYTQASITSRGANADLQYAKNNNFVDFLTYIVGSKKIGIPTISSADDLERIGDIHQFSAALFWEEIDSTLRRELDPGVIGRLINLLPTNKYSDYQFREAIINDIGNNVVGLSTQDPNGRWAYIHAYIRHDKQKKFNSLMRSGKAFELAEYGAEIVGAYEEDFRESRNQAARAKLNEVVQVYRGYVSKYIESQSTILLPKAFHGKVDNLPTQNFVSALKSDGSAQKLIDELISKRNELEFSETPEKYYSLSSEADYLLKAEFVNGLKASVTKYNLSLSQVGALLARLESNSEFEWKQFFTSIRWFVNSLGGSESGYERVLELLIKSNDVNSREALIKRTMLVEPSLNENDDPHSSEWQTLFDHSVLLHFIINTRAIGIDVANGEFNIDKERKATQILASNTRHIFFENYDEAKLEDPQKQSLPCYTVASKSRKTILDALYTYPDDSIAKNVLLGYIITYGVNSFDHFIHLGGAIGSSRSNSSYLRELLLNSLRPVFSQEKTPEILQAEILDVLVERLLSDKVSQSFDWREKVRATRTVTTDATAKLDSNVTSHTQKDDMFAKIDLKKQDLPQWKKVCERRCKSSPL